MHTESIADLLATELTELLRPDTLKKLIDRLLKSCLSLDLSSHKRPGSGELFWEEVRKTQKQRNQVVHYGMFASQDDCKTAIDVASYILGTVFPSLITKLGLRFEKLGILRGSRGVGFFPDWPGLSSGDELSPLLSRWRLWAGI